jgi:hypothetical protein
VRPPHLSKSKYLAGLQCEKRLWLQCRDRSLATPPDAAQQAIFDSGHEVGECAHALFPGGVLVREAPWRHVQAVDRTRRLMQDPAVPAIFEAAFEHADVRIRVDALERLAGGRFGLREVKASASVKQTHLDDLAVQRFVLEGCGVAVGSVELVHVNREYQRGDGPIDWRAYFVRVDCQDAIEQRQRALPSAVDAMRALAERDEAPAVEPGGHCHAPHDCEYWEHCTRGMPADWLYTLPRLGAARFAALRDAGHQRISALPDDVELTVLQRRVRDAVRSGEAVVSERLRAALRTLEPPVWYLDFETLSPALPLYPGTRPYEVLPFQWSVHRLDTRGRVTHREFLATGGGDPRRAVAESLLAALEADDAPIAVYSGFEQSRLGDLMVCLPELSERLERLRNRLVDLLDLVRGHVYHPAFGGSFSIKSVAPALVPGFGYGDLGALADGAAASAALLRIARGPLDAEREPRLREHLLAYCERDTQAMLEVHRALREVAS